MVSRCLESFRRWVEVVLVKVIEMGLKKVDLGRVRVVMGWVII